MEYFRTEELSVGYRGKVLLGNINIGIEKGKILTLVGPNGTGKSTILKTIIRQLEKIGGTVYVGKQDMKTWNIREMAKQVSVVLTEKIHPELMTCEEVVAMGRYPYTNALGKMTPEDRKVVEKALRTVHGEELAERDFSSLSDGQKQRIMLARAICQEPEMLVLDEPTAYLDIRFKMDLLNVLRDMADREGLTVVMSLHEVELAKRVSDKVLCIGEEGIDRYGTPKEVFTLGYIAKLFHVDMSTPLAQSYIAELEQESMTQADALQRDREQESVTRTDGTQESMVQADALQRDREQESVTQTDGTQESMTQADALQQDGEQESATRTDGTQESMVQADDGTQSGAGVRHVNQKTLRCGVTTGTCAAAAAGAAMKKLLEGVEIPYMEVNTPKGVTVQIPVIYGESTGEYCEVFVKKDSGDDPDVTNGTRIGVRAERLAQPVPSNRIEKVFRDEKYQGLYLDGGTGVGRVTKSGLEQSVGQAAINKVPREMIFSQAEAVRKQAESREAFLLTVLVPEGEALAKKTFNPMLGIEGGISILGTSGILEPMSEKAIVDTIETQIRQMQRNGERNLLVTPGNYGQGYVTEKLGFSLENSVKSSNYIGETIDLAVSYGMERLLLVGNIGKLAKLGAGIMNTHSRMADGRAEILGFHLMLCGGSREQLAELSACITTEEMLKKLESWQLREAVMESLCQKIGEHVKRRAGETLQTGVMLFSENYGFLGQTAGTEEVLSAWKKS